MIKVELDWGLSPVEVPEGSVVWGARAILERHGVKGSQMSIPWDRYDWKGGDHSESRAALADWASEQLQQIDTWDLFMNWYDKAEMFSVDEDGYHLRYDTKGSFGYVYFTAWRDPS